MRQNPNGELELKSVYMTTTTQARSTRAKTVEELNRQVNNNVRKICEPYLKR